MKKYIIKVVAILLAMSGISTLIPKDANAKEISQRKVITEVESNNVLKDANKITVNPNNQYVGRINKWTDRDCYKFEIKEDMEITMNFAHDKINSNNVYFTVQIIEDDFKEMLTFKSKGTDTRIQKKVGLKKGVYYVLIDSVDSYTSMQYRFALNGQRGNFEAENNDEKELANLIKLDTVYTGAMNTNIDKDYFKVNIPSNGELKINLSFDGEDTKGYSISVFDNNNVYLENIIEAPSKRISRTIGLKKGTYYIKVGEFVNNTNSRYNLSCSFKENLSFETEKNNSKALANKMVVDKAKFGNNNEQYDVDYFKIYVPKSGRHQFSFSLVDRKKASGTMMIRLTPDNANKEVALINTDKIGREQTKEVYLNKGVYYITVNSHAAIEENNYKIALYENTDYNSSWAKNSIVSAMNKGWVNKTNAFRPDDAITRAEFIKIVNKAYGFTSKATAESFTDVAPGHWYYNDVKIALKAGYISGKLKEFRPNDFISREEVAAILTDLQKNRDVNLDKIRKFKDYGKISTWAKTSVEGAVEAGYMGRGSDYFRPTENITRAEAVVTLDRIK